MNPDKFHRTLPPSVGMKPNRRNQVSILLSELREACRRPLFSEIVLVKDLRARRKQDRMRERRRCVHSENESEADTCSPQHRYRDQESDALKNLPWEEVRNMPSRVRILDSAWGGPSQLSTLLPMIPQLLVRASQLAPSLTDSEHTEILQLSSIFLLGFILPYSTGNDWHLLRGADAFMPGFDPVQYVLNMPLEKRMAKSVRRFLANEYGEVNTLADPDLEIALDSFLFQGLGTLLSSRPISRDKADLLHVMALAICPTDSGPNLAPATLQRLDKQNHPCWRRTKQLMRDSVGPSQFCLGYGTRLKIIEIINKCVSLPVPLEEQSSEVVAPLLLAAVPHLLSSLHDFAHAWAMSDADADLAREAQATLARCNETTLREEWDFELHNLCEGEVCDCCGDGSKCYYARRQRLLSSMFRPTSSRSTMSAHALSSLMDALEWQMEIWTETDDKDDDKMDTAGTTERAAVEKKLIPCLLVSLLSCAALWFRTYDPNRSFLGLSETNDAPCATIFRASLIFMFCSDARIRKAAMGLLEAALTRAPILDEKLLNDVCVASTRLLALSDGDHPHLTPGDSGKKELRRDGRTFLGMIAKRSCSVAAFLLERTLQLASSQAPNGEQLDVYCSLIAYIATNCPLSATTKTESLLLLSEKDTSLTGTMNIMAVLMSLRKTRYFVGAGMGTEGRVMQVFSTNKVDSWTKWKMARHAMLSGNFYVAYELFSQLCQQNLSEKYFLWLSTMQHFALAEALLAKNASKGIPEASIKLRSGLTFLDSLQNIFEMPNETFSFISSFLHLRLDFLDLLTILRHIIWQMRLTGSGPKKYTRQSLHIRNVIKGLVRLSNRYRDLVQCFGVQFSYCQSTVSLCLLQKSCLFLANAARSAFSGSVVVDQFLAVHFTSSEDSIGPLCALMKKLQTIVDGMDPSIDPVIRAQAMLEITDGMLMVPVSIPADIFSPLQKRSFELSLSADPEENDDNMGELDVIETSPSLSFTFICSGRLSPEISSRVVTVLLWYRMHYLGPVDEDDAAPNIEEPTDLEGEEAPPDSLVLERMPDVAPFSPASAALLVGGRFCFPVLCPPLLDEGFFRIEAKLGCQDHLGNQWKLGSGSECRFIDVRVLRNR